MKLSFENNGTRLQLETPKQFDVATGTAFLDDSMDKELLDEMQKNDPEEQHG